MADPVSWIVAGSAIIGGAAAGFGAYEEIEAEKEQARLQEQSIHLQQEEIEMKRKGAEVVASKQQTQRSQKLIEVEAQQEAQAAAQGMGPGSGSFGALVKGSYGRYAEASQDARYNLDMKEGMFDMSSAELDMKQAAIRARLHQQEWGTLINAITTVASDAASAASGMPNLGASAPKSTGGYNASNPKFWAEMGQWTEQEMPDNLVEKYTHQGPFAQWLSK